MKRKAHVRKDGSPSYKMEIRINGQRLTKRFSRIADAEKWYAEKKREKELVESGMSAAGSGIETRLCDYVEIWMEKRRQQGKPLGSWLTDGERLKKWVQPIFGTRSLQKISSQELETFLDKLVTKEGLSPTTRNRVRAVLHKLYNDAKRQGLVQWNPVSNVIPWKENNHAFDYWHSLEDCQSYLAQADAESPSFYVFAMLAVNTGARLGELLALQNHDVDLVNRRLHLCKLKEFRNGEICKRTKGGGDRWLGLNDELFQVLSEQRRKSKFNKPNDFVVHDSNGDSMYACKVRVMHWRVCKAAGLRKIRVHDLRHTFASHFVMNGGSLHDLQALLGHSSPMMTQRYAHLAPGYLETKAQVVRFGKFTGEVRALKVVK
jgi:integrase